MQAIRPYFLVAGFLFSACGASMSADARYQRIQQLEAQIERALQPGTATNLQDEVSELCDIADSLGEDDARRRCASARARTGHSGH